MAFNNSNDIDAFLSWMGDENGGLNTTANHQSSISPSTHANPEPNPRPVTTSTIIFSSRAIARRQDIQVSGRRVFVITTTKLRDNHRRGAAGNVNVKHRALPVTTENTSVNGGTATATSAGVGLATAAENDGCTLLLENTLGKLRIDVTAASATTPPIAFATEDDTAEASTLEDPTPPPSPSPSHPHQPKSADPTNLAFLGTILVTCKDKTSSSCERPQIVRCYTFPI